MGAQRQTWWRKRNRLDREVYRGAATFAVTMTTWQRRRAFVTAEEVGRYREMLEDTGRSCSFHILAYCFMPDHLHVLLQGAEESRLIPFVQRFKQATGYWFKERTGTTLWQRSFYDHVLRGEEDIGDVAEYIWSNPVRAGLVLDRDDYPYWGPRGQT